MCAKFLVKIWLGSDYKQGGFLSPSPCKTNVHKKSCIFEEPGPEKQYLFDKQIDAPGKL